MSIVFGTNRISFFLHGCNPLFLVKLFLALLVVDRHGSYGITSSHIFSLTRVKIHQVHNELQNLSLDNRSISDYLLHVQTLDNALTSIGEFVSNSEHLNLILDGLPDI